MKRSINFRLVTVFAVVWSLVACLQSKKISAGRSLDVSQVDVSQGINSANGAIKWVAFRPQKLSSAFLGEEYSNWKKKYFYECPDHMSADVKQNDQQGVSEGAGYGLLLAFAMNDKSGFDKILAGVLARQNNNGLMDWQFPLCGSATSSWAKGSASDAELDIAFALVRAEQKWGGYKNIALQRISAIKLHQITNCHGKLVLKADDTTDGCLGNGRPRINPSYSTPGYYRVFAEFDAINAQFWRQMLDDTYTLISQIQDKSAGLISDWGFDDGQPDGPYGYEACRVPWRMLLDYGLSGDSRAQKILGSISQVMIQKGGLKNNGYDQNSCFIGGFAIAGSIRSQDDANSLTSEWLSIIGDHDDAYYQGTLRVLYMTTLYGGFQ